MKIDDCISYVAKSRKHYTIDSIIARLNIVRFKSWLTHNIAYTLQSFLQHRVSYRIKTDRCNIEAISNLIREQAIANVQCAAFCVSHNENEWGFAIIAVSPEKKKQ